MRRPWGARAAELHAVTDALGLPIHLSLSLGPGQQNEMTAAYGLIQGIHAGAVLADRAYDADGLHDIVLEQGVRGAPFVRMRSGALPVAVCGLDRGARAGRRFTAAPRG